MNRAALFVAIFVACAVFCHCQAQVSPSVVNSGVVTILKAALRRLKDDTPQGYTLRLWNLRFQVHNQELVYPDPTPLSRVTRSGNTYRWTLTNFRLELRGSWRTWLITRPSAVTPGTFAATLDRINLSATFTFVNGRLTVQSAGGSVGRVGFSIRGGRMNFILSWLFRIHTEQALRQEGENKLCQNLKNILSGN